MPFSKFVSTGGKEKRSVAATALSRVEIKVIGPQVVTYVALVHRMDIRKNDRMNKKPLEDALVVPYWLVRCVQDKNIANMRQSSMPCTLAVETGGEAADDQHVTLPILHNVKALEEGAELVLFVEPSLPSSIMPVQTLEQVAKQRPVAATGRMQQTANKKKKR